MRVRSESGITIVPKMVDFGRGSFKIRPSICIKIEINSWSFTSTGEKNRYFIDSNIIYGSLGKPDTRAQILRNAVALSWSEMIYYRYWFDWNGLQQANKRTMSTRNSLRIIFNERKLVDLIAVFQKVLELNESAVLSSIRTSIKCIVMLCVPNRHLKTSEEREKTSHTNIDTPKTDLYCCYWHIYTLNSSNNKRNRERVAFRSIWIFFITECTYR